LKIKKLPKKARSSKKAVMEYNSLLTFFKKGKLRKIFLANKNTIEEIDFDKAAEILKSDKEIKREKINTDFYDYLKLNKKEFDAVFIQDANSTKLSRGRSQEAKLVKIIKAIINSKEFTDDDETYLQEVLTLLREGGIAKVTIKKIMKNIRKETNPFRILAKIKAGISPRVFQGTFTGNVADTSGLKEVILSEYLIKDG